MNKTLKPLKSLALLYLKSKKRLTTSFNTASPQRDSCSNLAATANLRFQNPGGLAENPLGFWEVVYKCCKKIHNVMIALDWFDNSNRRPYGAVQEGITEIKSVTVHGVQEQTLGRIKLSKILTWGDVFPDAFVICQGQKLKKKWLGKI